MLHYVALVIGIIFNATANILIKSAMRKVDLSGTMVETALNMAFQPLLIVGLVCFVIALGGYSFALTKIDLSVGYPAMTCLGLIIVAGYATLRFAEPLTGTKILGFVLVLVGVALVFANQNTPTS